MTTKNKEQNMFLNIFKLLSYFKEPSTAPSGITIDKLIVSWTEIPRTLANGQIENYEIKTVSLNQKRRRRSNDEGNVVNATSPHTLEDLRTYTSYSLSIRGYTSAGPGPFSIPVNMTTRKYL
jgi:hypothetical protein